MKIKLTLPINMEMLFKKTGSTMENGIYPVSVDGKNVGFGKVLKVEDFDIIIELDTDSEKYYKENFTKEELKQFCV
ncbi:TPA: hypothetical protein N2D99_002312 [Clostridium botulinum]|nr:hypothetical protein [Clostridium botulinum]